MRNKENSIKGWLREERTTMLATILCPIVATVFTVLAFFRDFKWLSFSYGASSYVTFLYLLQAIFIGVTFCYIWGKKKRTTGELKKQKDNLKIYFQKEFNIGDEDNLSLDDRFDIVNGTVNKFFYGWMIVWMIWLFYYGITFIENFLGTDSCNAFLKTYNQFVFRCGSEFVCAIIVFFIYLTLNNVTIAKEYREEESSADFRLGTLFMILCMVGIGALFLHCSFFSEGKYAFSSMLLTSMAVGTFSTLAFVLMLGKLNSYYLQIPVFLNLLVYAYAIIQIFSPFSLLAEGWDNIQDNFVIMTIGNGYKCCCNTCSPTNRVAILTPQYSETIKNFLNIICVVFHFLCLVGKLSLALVLYWSAYKSRFLYFVVTKSLALTETPEKLMTFWKYMGRGNA